MEVWGEIGGGKMPLARGKEKPLSESRRGLQDVGWEGLPREAELGGSLMGAKRDLRWVADATHRGS